MVSQEQPQWYLVVGRVLGDDDDFALAVYTTYPGAAADVFRATCCDHALGRNVTLAWTDVLVLEVWACGATEPQRRL